MTNGNVKKIIAYLVKWDEEHLIQHGVSNWRLTPSEKTLVMILTNGEEHRILVKEILTGGFER